MATQKRRPSDAVKDARKRIEKARDEARDAAQHRVAQVAVSIVDFQKSTFNSTVDGIGRAQEQAGKALHNLAKKAKWAPEELGEAVDEWNATTKRAREDFKKSMNKSFDLLHKVIERARKSKPAAKKATAKKTAAKKKPAKKKAAKRKAAPKKKAASRKKPAANA